MSLSKHLTTGRMIPSGTNTPLAEVSIYDPDHFPSWTVQLNIKVSVSISASSTHTHTSICVIFGKSRKTNHNMLYMYRVSILLTCGNHFHDCFLSLSACSEVRKWAVMYMCSRGIHFASMHDFSNGCWNFSNCYVLSLIVICLAYAMKGE